MFTQLQAHFLCSKLLVIQTHNSTKWRVYHFTFGIYWLGNRGLFVICHHKCSKDILSLSIRKICNSKFTALSWNLQSLCICDSCTFRRKSKINWKFSSIFQLLNPVNFFLPKIQKDHSYIMLKPGFLKNLCLILVFGTFESLFEKSREHLPELGAKSTKYLKLQKWKCWLSMPRPAV